MVPGTLSLRRYGASPGSHSHSHFQVLLGLSGMLELEIDGRGMRVPSGSGCVIAPGARHDFEARRGSLCLVLDSDSEGWAHCVQRTAPATAWPLARYLASALSQRPQPPLAQSLGPALLLEAWQAVANSGARAQAAAPARGRPIDWTALERWAAQNWHQPLTVADLASRVHLSPGQFAARCQSEQGVGAMAWLRAGGMAVAEVARQTGYRSPSALTAALRRIAER